MIKHNKIKLILMILVIGPFKITKMMLRLMLDLAKIKNNLVILILLMILILEVKIKLIILKIVKPNQS